NLGRAAYAVTAVAAAGERIGDADAVGAKALRRNRRGIAGDRAVLRDDESPGLDRGDRIDAVAGDPVAADGADPATAVRDDASVGETVLGAVDGIEPRQAAGSGSTDRECVAIAPLAAHVQRDITGEIDKAAVGAGEDAPALARAAATARAPGAERGERDAAARTGDRAGGQLAEIDFAAEAVARDTARIAAGAIRA